MTKKRSLSAGTWQRDHDQLHNWVVPYLGNRPIAAIEAPELLEVLKRIETKGIADTAHRTRAVCGRVFRYAIATGRATRDISADLRGALAARNTKSYAAITEPAKVGELLRAIDGYDGQPPTAAALKLAPYVFVRPGELRAAEWAEFILDGDEPVWRIPAERMKMREPHIVPLSRQAVAVLRELQPVTGHDRYVFPAIGGGGRPLSENTLNGALRRLGYSSEQMTSHGFRSIASTLLNERGVNPDLIELQLAHAERNKVRAAYNRAQRLAERRAMMQDWADFLDNLRTGWNVAAATAAAARLKARTEANVKVAEKLTTGVVEGFFGRPWTWTARLDGIEFLRQWGYRFYIYAPKADPFLRRRWRDPIPPDTMQHLLEVSERCRRTGIALGLGLSPFEIYLNYNAEAKRDLRSKVLQINEVGAEILCILFDDMQGNLGNLAERQGSVISDICTWSRAKNFIVCPTYYSDDPRLAQQFGSAPETYLQDLGQMVDPRVDFFWTGERVISDGYSQQHLANVSSKIGRKPFLWDNHIANDSKTRVNYLFLHPRDSWGLSVEHAAGLAVNPMNQPYLSHIALAGYRLLLSGKREGLLSVASHQVCGRSFAERLLEDAHLLQTCGLPGLSREARTALLTRYARDTTNRWAQEISSWLRGEYAFDPECLTS